MVKRPSQPRRPQTPAELESLPVRHNQAAGIDVGDRTHWVVVGATPDGSATTREFPAHTPGLRAMMDWLRLCGVTTVALEASGAYGHVLSLTLINAGFVAVVTSPAFTRQIKGRPKTDRLDCQWILRLHTHGLLPPVFQPDDATHTLRAYVRQRANLVRISGQYIQRMQKALQLMNLKLTNVIGDITGVTTVGHFASWLGLCQSFQKTGGKVKSSKTRKGKNRAATALRLAAWGLMKSQSYLGAYLRRQKSRLGPMKAITATAHKLARIIYNMLRFGVEYVKKDEAVYAEQVRERLDKQLHRRAKELGYQLVKLPEAQEPAVEAETPLPV